MMDFPASPTEGQEFVSPAGYAYKFTSGAWALIGAGGSVGATGPQGATGPIGLTGGAITTISDTAPGGAVNGQLWWNSTDGSFYIYYNDGSSSQWVRVAL